MECGLCMMHIDSAFEGDDGPGAAPNMVVAEEAWKTDWGFERAILSGKLYYFHGACFEGLLNKA